MKKLSFTMLVLAGWSISACAQPLKNGGFEAPYQPAAKPTSPQAQIDGEVAEGWRDESGWGEVSLAYSRDEANAHGGASAQRLEVRSIGEGAAQLVQQTVFKAGHTYRATAYLRSASAAKASLRLRKSGNPYTTYANTEVQLTPEWQKVEVTSRVSEDTDGLLMFLPAAAGTYWIDDATCEDITESGAVPAPVQNTANTATGPIGLRNGSMEGTYAPVSPPTSPQAKVEGELAPGWRDDSGWGEVSIAYSREANGAHQGTGAQRIELRSIGRGALQFVQDVPLKVGRIYRASAYLRAATNVQATLQLRQRGAPYEISGLINAQLSPEWRYFEFYVRQPQNVDGLFLFTSREPNTYWVDNAKLEDVTDAVTNQGDPREGNLLSNGSFEAGLAAGWSGRITAFDNNLTWAPDEHLDLKTQTDSTTAANGKKSLTATLKPWNILIFTSPLVQGSFGRTYTGSIALKSDKPQDVQLRIDGTTADKTVRVGPNWARYSVSGSANMGTTVRLTARVIARNIPAPIKVWLDAGMLEEGDTASPEYLASHPIELALRVPRPGSIVFDGQAAPVEVQAIGSNQTLPQGARLKWSVEDLKGQVRPLPNAPLPVKALTIPPDTKTPRGLFKIKAQVVDAAGKPLSAPIEQVFARLPQPRTLSEQQKVDSYFGVHVQLRPDYFSIAKAIGSNWVRLHYGPTTTQWAIVEPKPGQWNWNDEGIKAARESGLHVLGMLDGAPPWASLKPQATHGFFSAWNMPDAPGATDKWQEYVRQTVTHYKPWISHWEIWNEPYVNGPTNAFFPNGTPEQYANLMQLASVAARAANPEVKLVGVCAPSGDPKWLDRVLKTAGPENYDYMSYHYYGDRLQGGPNSNITVNVNELKEVQARHGQAKPLWNSEGNGTTPSWYHPENSLNTVRYPMSVIVRMDVAQLAAGVQKYFLYTLHGEPSQGDGDLMALENDRSIKPQLAARAVLASLIDGAKFVAQKDLMPGVVSYTFQQPKGQQIQVLWSYDAKPHSLAVTPKSQVFDILGNAISGKTIAVSDEPLYLVTG